MRSYLETRALVLPIAFESLAEIGLWEFEYDDPIAYMAKSGDPDTMYLDDALKAPDRNEFIKAMQHEVAQHEERGHALDHDSQITCTDWNENTTSGVEHETKTTCRYWRSLQT